MTTVEAISSLPSAEWLRLRMALWPDTSETDHRSEMQRFVSSPDRYVNLLARSAAGRAVGFAEAALRFDHVNGTESSPVAFLEGLYVEPASRRRGVARALVAGVVAWARERGCAELASDTELDNLDSQAVHLRLGFREAERVVCFRRSLHPDSAA